MCPSKQGKIMENTPVIRLKHTKKKRILTSFNFLAEDYAQLERCQQLLSQQQGVSITKLQVINAGIDYIEWLLKNSPEAISK